jgi:uncharacterized protein
MSRHVDPLIATHLDRIHEIARDNGVRGLRVFGSRATGDAHESSDLDLLVQMEDGRTLWDLAGFRADLEDLLGYRVDVVTEAALSPYLRENILADAVPLDPEAA